MKRANKTPKQMGATPLFVAVHHKASLELVKFLAENGADVNETNLVSGFKKEAPRLTQDIRAETHRYWRLAKHRISLSLSFFWTKVPMLLPPITYVIRVDA